LTARPGEAKRSSEIDLEPRPSADTGFDSGRSDRKSFADVIVPPGEIHEFYHNGVRGFVDPGTGVITLSQPDFDLRFEGNGDATPAGQISPTDVNRDKVGFNGTTCSLPSNPQIAFANAVIPGPSILPGPFVTTPTTAANSLINAYAPVTINLLARFLR
jgi:hypothetical protein